MGVQRRGRALLKLGALHVAELCAEIRPIVAGARIAAVRPLPPADIILVLESQLEPHPVRLCISADPDAPRIHVQHERVDAHDGPLGPFFRRVVHDLTGASISSIAPVRADRIVIAEVRDSPAGARRALLAELVGRHSNLVLLGPDDEVLDVLVPPRADATDARLAIGRTWSAPPGSSGARAPAESAPVRDAFPVPARPPPVNLAHPAPASWTVELALGEQASSARIERARTKLLERVERKLSRARALLKGLEQRLAAGAQHERLRIDGELLKANMHLLKRGLRHIDLEDVFAEDAPTRRIELDPKRSPQDNLTHIFERAKKLERSLHSVENEIELARTRIRELERLSSAASADGADIYRLEAEAVERGWLDPPQEADERKRKAPAPRLPYKTFRAAKGSEIRVGRNARDNDDLTFHHARGNDVWLHTADAPGSHVVLCLAGAPESDPDELLDAAHLAVHFSPLRGSRRASVHVARRKEVHKPRGAKPGLVTLSGGRILDVRVQPERMTRLLGDQRQHGAGTETS
jgi:predicted ribosome quality control (RQC) complex YloA/Tae2 family protein